MPRHPSFKLWPSRSATERARPYGQLSYEEERSGRLSRSLWSFFAPFTHLSGPLTDCGPCLLVCFLLCVTWNLFLLEAFAKRPLTAIYCLHCRSIDFFFLDLLGFVYDHMTFVLYPPGQLYQHSLGHLHTFTSVVVEHLLSPCQTLWSMCSAFGHTALSTSCSTRAAIEQTQTPDARSKPRLGHAKPITMRHSLLRRTSRGDGFSYLGEWEQRNRGNCFPRVRHREASPRHVRAGNEKPGDGVCGHGR